VFIFEFCVSIKNDVLKRNSKLTNKFVVLNPQQTSVHATAMLSKYRERERALYFTIACIEKVFKHRYTFETWGDHRPGFFKI